VSFYQYLSKKENSEENSQTFLSSVICWCVLIFFKIIKGSKSLESHNCCHGYVTEFVYAKIKAAFWTRDYRMSYQARSHLCRAPTETVLSVCWSSVRAHASQIPLNVFQ